MSPPNARREITEEDLGRALRAVRRHCGCETPSDAAMAPGAPWRPLVCSHGRALLEDGDALRHLLFVRDTVAWYARNEGTPR